MSLCANCGKGEEVGSDLKTCTACKSIKYCSRDCQIAHRPQHKKECKKKAKELHDEKLFKQPPPLEDCPICFLRMPSLPTGRTYMSCCGKMICTGCLHAPVYDEQGNIVAKKTCSFCRIPTPIAGSDQILKQYRKRVELDDPIAINQMGSNYAIDGCGLPQDTDKAFELWNRAGELGSADAYCNIGLAYQCGQGVDVDKKKALYYYELAAMGGDEFARHDLGETEVQAGNMDRALKHFMIAARDGEHDSLKNIKTMYKNGYATKDDYAKALRSYQAYLGEIKSEQRDKAAAFHDDYKYYESAV